MLKQIVLSFLLLLTTLYCSISLAQNGRPKFKYGDVKESDFAPKSYAVDTSANAVFLFDKGTSSYEGNNNGYLSVVYKKHTRMRIMNKNGFDAATISFPLFHYDDNTEDKLDKFEAVTYNMENGKIIETKLDKSGVFKDKVSKGAVVYKFTFPNVKEGSIVEYRYTVIVPNPTVLRPWYFQGEYPRLWSELDISIPAFYEFQPFKRGLGVLAYDTIMETNDTYNIISGEGNAYQRTTAYSLTTTVTRNIWAMKDVKGLKDEPYVSSSSNYQSRVDFFYTAFRPSENEYKPAIRNWSEMSEKLMKNPAFGLEIKNPGDTYNEDLLRLTKSDSDDLTKAKKIYYYVRDTFSCIDNEEVLLSQPLKKIYASRKGSVADINLTLVTMYKSMGFEAFPLILSTRDNGMPPPNFPRLRDYNYVICRLKLGDQFYLLDASRKNLGFNKLDHNCYNENGRVINDIPLAVTLTTDSLKETKKTAVFLTLDDNKKSIGSFSSELSYYESQAIREKLKKQSKEDYFNEIKKEYPTDVKLSNFSIDSLNNYEESIKMNYDIDLNWEDDMIYFNPLFAEGYKTNPFKAATRNFPVEMPFTSDEIYTLSFEIPDGYVVEEVPKSAKATYESSIGYFEYIISATPKMISLRYRLKFDMANFSAESYDSLREFYDLIVKKHAEQIVLKKKAK